MRTVKLLFPRELLRLSEKERAGVKEIELPRRACVRSSSKQRRTRPKSGGPSSSSFSMASTRCCRSPTRTSTGF